MAGKYRVERVLGEGGMGVVVEARHLALEERVALKFLLPRWMANPESPARFMREARAAAKIKSEHIARVSDVGTLDTGAPYMVMEFLEGSDLAHALKHQGGLPIADAVDYLIQACEAIAEAHSHGIVHRDLKPANLFLTWRRDSSPLVKVLDFGISKRMGPEVDNLTRTSAAIGSALYMSPEQMQETRSVDHRTDIYALGVTLFELLTATHPFFAESMPQLCAAVLTGAPRPLRAFRPEVPEGLAAIAAKAYERDRAQRYQSVGELVVDLAPYAPPRSYGIIERVARVCGVEPPALARISAPPEVARDRRSSSPPATLPQGTYPVHAASGYVAEESSQGDRVSPAPQATGRPSSPSVGGSDFRRGSPSGIPERTSPVPAVTYSATQPLPAISEDTKGPEAEEIPSKVVVSGYMAPFSAKASAAFASGAPLPAPPARPERRRTTGVSPLVVGMFAVGLAALAAVIVAIILRTRSLPDPAGEASPRGSESAPAASAPAAVAPGSDVAPEVARPPSPVVAPEVSSAPAAAASTPAAPSQSAVGSPSAARVQSPGSKPPAPKPTEAPKPSASGKTNHGILSTSR